MSSYVSRARGRIAVSCRPHGRLMARASRPFVPNQKLTGETPVPLTLTLQETEMRPCACNPRCRSADSRTAGLRPAAASPGPGRWNSQVTHELQSCCGSQSRAPERLHPSSARSGRRWCVCRRGGLPGRRFIDGSTGQEWKRHTGLADKSRPFTSTPRCSSARPRATHDGAGPDACTPSRIRPAWPC